MLNANIHSRWETSGHLKRDELIKNYAYTYVHGTQMRENFVLWMEVVNVFVSNTKLQSTEKKTF